MNLNQRPMVLRQASPTGAGSKIGLKVMPADSVTLSEGRCPGERTPTRLGGCGVKSV